MSVTKELIENYRVAADGEWASISLRCWTRRPAARTSEDFYCGEITINSSLGAAVARRLAALAKDGRVSHVQIGTQVYWRAAA